MKTSIRFKMWAFFLALAALFVAVSLAIDCPPTPLTPAPPDIDPNLVHFKILCVVRAREGQIVTKHASACDADGDLLNYRLLQAPQGMAIKPSNDPNAVAITWVAMEGVWHIDLEVYDSPPDSNDSLTDRGSMVYIIGPRNRPPIWGGCR